MLRRDQEGGLILTVAAPVRSYRQSWEPDVDSPGRRYRGCDKTGAFRALMLFIPAFVMLGALSFWLSRTIATGGHPGDSG